MTVELFGFPLSQPTRSVLLLLQAADVAHEFKVVNFMAGEHKKPEYLAINPHGKVPAIRDGDFTLSEGAAILTYVAESHNLHSWYPEDVKQRAKVNEWLHWVHTTIRKTSTFNLLRPVVFKLPFDNKEQSLKEHEAVISELETHLSTHKFLVGENPTIADLFVIPEVDQLTFFGIFSYEKFPNVQRWINDIATHVKSYNGNVELVKQVVAQFASSS